MQPKLNTASVLDLTLGNYTISGASISGSRDGTKFTFTIGPVTDGTLAALDGVARKHGRLYLYCYGRPLLFDLVSLERKEPNKVRLVMRRIDGDTLIAAA